MIGRRDLAPVTGGDIVQTFLSAREPIVCRRIQARTYADVVVERTAGMTETQQAAFEAEMREAGIRVITQADADATKARLEAAGLTVVTEAPSTVTLLHKTTTEDAARSSGVGK